MSDGELVARVVAAGDQVDAALRRRRSALFAEFIEGPGPGVVPLEPVRCWLEQGVWCAVLTGPVGFLCGYARLPDGHPWVGLHYGEPVPDPRRLDLDEQPVEQAFDDHGVLPVFLAALGGDEGVEEYACSVAAHVPVHGGLTWAGPMPIVGAPHGWWLGFDCGHAGDAVDEEAWRRTHPWASDEQARLLCGAGGHVWTVDEVSLEVKRMVPPILQAMPSECREEGSRLD